VVHAPQWAKSVCRLTHNPEQFVSPLWQLTAHVPFEHTWPGRHTLPQPPQLARSVFVLTHSPEHGVSSAWQLKEHVPDEHTCPATHDFVHDPQ